VGYARIEKQLRPLLIYLEALSNEEGLRADNSIEHHDYGELVLSSTLLTMQEVRDFISSIMNHKKVILPGDASVDVTGDNADGYFLNSKADYAYVWNAWPFYYAGFNIPQTRVNNGYRILAKRGSPTFPDTTTAISRFAKLSGNMYDYSSSPKLIIILPDFRARISGMRKMGRKITLSGEFRSLPKNKVVAKFYLSEGSRSFQSGDLNFDESGSVVLDCDFDPESILACILGDNEEIVDAREFNIKWQYEKSDIIVETPNEKIEELIVRGENENVEFKQQPGDDFLETFVSYANAGGGMILLGVNKYGQLSGYDPGDMDSFRDKITCRILSNIIPSTIKFQLQKAEFEGSSLDQSKKKVVVITVFKGKQRPYYLRDRGIMMRHGGTDSWITPSELDEIYADKNRSDRGIPWGSL